MRYAFEIEKESIGSIPSSSHIATIAGCCFLLALLLFRCIKLANFQSASISIASAAGDWWRRRTAMRRRRVFCVCQTLRYDSPVAAIHTRMNTFIVLSTIKPQVKSLNWQTKQCSFLLSYFCNFEKWQQKVMKQNSIKAVYNLNFCIFRNI